MALLVAATHRGSSVWAVDDDRLVHNDWRNMPRNGKITRGVVGALMRVGRFTDRLWIQHSTMTLKDRVLLTTLCTSYWKDFYENFAM